MSYVNEIAELVIDEENGIARYENELISDKDGQLSGIIEFVFQFDSNVPIKRVNNSADVLTVEDSANVNDAKIIATEEDINRKLLLVRIQKYNEESCDYTKETFIRP